MELNCEYVVSEMFDIFTSLYEIFRFLVSGKCYSGLLLECIYYIVQHLFVRYTNHSVFWVQLNVINMLNTKYRSGSPNSKSVNSNVHLIQTFLKISAKFLSM